MLREGPTLPEHLFHLYSYWKPPRNPLGTSRTAPFVFVGRFGLSANTGAERTPRKLRGSSLRPFLGPR
eukprot:13051146-Alexandrium_andersonii.AAC.1